MKPYSTAIPNYATWEGGFTKDELDWIQSEARKADSSSLVGRGDGSGIGKSDSSIRRSNIKWLDCTDNTMWLYEKLAYFVSSLNSTYFKFDLTGMDEPLQLSNYQEEDNGTYGWHQDSGIIGLSRKLSLVLQLSDACEYEGGNLQIRTNSEPETITKQRGTVIVFPSYTVHQVTPVLSGNRQSLVSWISGPQFR